MSRLTVRTGPLKGRTFRNIFDLAVEQERMRSRCSHARTRVERVYVNVRRGTHVRTRCIDCHEVVEDHWER